MTDQEKIKKLLNVLMVSYCMAKAWRKLLAEKWNDADQSEFEQIEQAAELFGVTGDEQIMRVLLEPIIGDEAKTMDVGFEYYLIKEKKSKRPSDHRDRIVRIYEACRPRQEYKDIQIELFCPYCVPDVRLLLKDGDGFGPEKHEEGFSCSSCKWFLSKSTLAKYLNNQTENIHPKMIADIKKSIREKAK